MLQTATSRTKRKPWALGSSLLFSLGNRLVTIADPQWCRLGWAGHRGQERTAGAAIRRRRPLLL